MYCSVARPVNLFFIKKEKKKKLVSFLPFPLPEVPAVATLGMYCT